ncbi:MAG: hypothetical protein OXD30_10860 [Bryobacterales bacterium]|nr:hypothetical protein [Bryobacterales bacterium]
MQASSTALPSDRVALLATMLSFERQIPAADSFETQKGIGV